MKKTNKNKNEWNIFILQQQFYQNKTDLTSHKDKNFFSKILYEHAKYIFLDLIFIMIARDMFCLIVLHMSIHQTWLMQLSQYLHIVNNIFIH